jgi:hypothetical protein
MAAVSSANASAAGAGAPAGAAAGVLVRSSAARTVCAIFTGSPVACTCM